MNQAKLSNKSHEELAYYANKLLDRSFDDRDVALFLIYGRASFARGSALYEFANSVAHTQRDRDHFFKAAERANNLAHGDWLTKNEPLGHVGYSVSDINVELDDVAHALGLPNVAPEAAEDFVVCLCAIGNHLEFIKGQDTLLGTTNTLAVNGTINLDLMPAAEHGSIILLKASLSTLPGDYIDYRDKRIHAVRNKPGAELRIVEG